jgi:hypothetical protein
MIPAGLGVHFTFSGSPNLNRNLNLCRLSPKWFQIRIMIKIRIRKAQPKKLKCTPGLAAVNMRLDNLKGTARLRPNL